jgi:lipopolysaccharide/colanic/teichoic acid biosynthesis glycosyltransferase
MHEKGNFNLYTQDDDNRIFPFGHTMRQMRIDELPQLWNVIKGEMYFSGLAQVSYPYGRNIYDAKQKLRYDMVYIQNWSLFLELKISLKTIQVILGKEGI